MFNKLVRRKIPLWPGTFRQPHRPAAQAAAVALSVCMVFTMMPSTVFAAASSTDELICRYNVDEAATASGSDAGHTHTPNRPQEPTIEPEPPLATDSDSKPAEFAITVQPEDQEAAEGEEVSFELEATGEGLSYQWQMGEPGPEADYTFDRNVALEDEFVWTDLDGEDAPEYTFTVRLEDLYDNVYRCIVTSGEEELVTNPVKVKEPVNRLLRNSPPSRPTVSGTNIYANGVNIRITAGSGGGSDPFTNILYDLDNDGTIDDDEYLRIGDAGPTAAGYDLTAYDIYGGTYRQDLNLGSNSTGIVMEGGTVENIYGGSFESELTGNTSIVMEGGTVENIYGGSHSWGTVATVRGNTNITVSGGHVFSLYGGGEGTGSAPTSPPYKISVVTGTAKITIGDPSGTEGVPYIENVYGGGPSGTATGATELIMQGGTVKNLSGGGDIMGDILREIRLEMTGGKVENNISASNSRSPEPYHNAYVILTGGTVGGSVSLNTGTQGPLSVATLTVGGGVKIGDGSSEGIKIKNVTSFAISPHLTGDDDSLTVVLPDGFNASAKPVIATGAAQADLAKIKLAGAGAANKEAYYEADSIKVRVTYGVELDKTGAHTFDSAVEGYGEQSPLSVQVSNIGCQPTGALTVSLTGANAGSFALSKTGISSIAPGGSGSFTVKPNTDLDDGVYSATVTVEGGNSILASFSVSFTVTPLVHSVTYTLTGLTAARQPAAVNNGTALSAVLTPMDSYKLPGAITVAMSGAPLTNGGGFTYNSSTGAVDIPSVTGNVLITADGVAKSGDATLSALAYQVGNGQPTAVPGFLANTESYSVTLPYDTARNAAITLAGTQNDANANVTENNGVSLVDGSGSAAIKVTAEDGTTVKTYTVNFTTAADTRSDARQITAFTIENQEGSTVIDQNMHKIAVTMPSGTDVTSLTPAITVSGKASVSPQSGAAQDFTDPVTYTVTAENKTTQAYTVTVTVQAPSGTEPAITHTITPSAGKGGTISPSSAVTVNEGESQTFTISANDHYRISNVTVDGVDKGPVNTWTFEDVTGNHRISVTFRYDGGSDGESSSTEDTVPQTPTTNTITSAAEDGGSVTTITTVWTDNRGKKTTVTTQVRKDASGKVTENATTVTTDNITTQLNQGDADVTVWPDASTINTAAKAAGAAAENPMDIYVTVPQETINSEVSKAEVKRVRVNVVQPKSVGDNPAVQPLGVTIDKETVEAARQSGKGLEVTVRKEAGDVEAVWSLDGQAMRGAAGQATDLNLGVRTAPVKSSDPIVAPVKSPLTAGKHENGLVISFSADGTLLSPAKLTVPATDQTGIAAGSGVVLYRFDPGAGTLARVPGGVLIM